MAGHAARSEAAEPSNKAVSMTDILGSATGVVSIVSSAAFVLSVVYEQAYFSVIGKEFRIIASLTDYFANALDWLPAVLTLLIGYWIFLVLVALMTPKLTTPKAKAVASGAAAATPVDSSQAAPAKETDKSGPEITWGAIVATLIAVGIVMYIYLFSDPASELGFAIVLSFVIWMFVVAFAVSRGGEFQAWIGTMTKVFVLFVPIVVGGIYGLGLQAAYRDLGSPRETFSLTRKDAQAQPPEEVNVLRTFDRGVLLRLPKQQVNQFLRWDEIRSITLPREGHAGKSLACRQLGWPC
jgi:hypothetical protein